MIELREFNQTLLEQAEAKGFSVENLANVGSHDIHALRRPPSRGSAESAPALYLSAGVHGDEPAGPLAALQLLSRDLLPRSFDITICPLLNPTGIEGGTRETIEGIDLNRDFRALATVEAATVVGYLNRRDGFDLSLCLHEDWESSGFYLYAIDAPESYSRRILESVSKIGPIESAAEIDGYSANQGLIVPPANLTLDDRSDWPEAFYLYSKAQHIHFTTETPSSLPLHERVEMQIVAVTQAIESYSEFSR